MNTPGTAPETRPVRSLVPINLTGAWQDRAEVEMELLAHAAQAPALFKPEAREQAADRGNYALVEARRWGGMR